MTTAWRILTRFIGMGGLCLLFVIMVSGCVSVGNDSGLPQLRENMNLPELKALQIWQLDDYNTYPVAAMLESKTGYHVKYDMLPQDKPEDKLKLLMTSDEVYDVVTIPGNSDMKALWADYAQRGELVDLGPLIVAYGSNLKQAISQETWDAVKVNGRIYAIPSKAAPNTSSGLLVRLDWMEQVGMDMPSTLYEFTTLLTAFRDQDPGSNGASNIPLTIRGDQPFIDNVAGAFGLANNWNDKDGVLVPRIMDSSYRSYIEYVKMLYDEQLLDREFVLNKEVNVREKFISGEAGIISTPYSEVPYLMDALNGNNPDARAIFLSVMSGAEGEWGFAGNASFSGITFIPKSSRHAEDVVKWINAKLDIEVFKNLAIGEEGVHHTYQDGSYKPILPKFLNERNAANNFLTGIDERYYYDYWKARVLKDPRLFEAWEVLNVNQPEGFRIIDPLGISPYLETYSKYNLQLNTMVTDYTVKLIIGVEVLSDLDRFIEQYASAGGDASYTEVNAWYSEKSN